MAVKIRKGDIVMVIAGDDKGKTGRVLAVDAEKQRVVVEKVNFIKRHTKARRQGAKSGILEKEAPLHLSNVALFNPATQKADRVGIKKLADGKRVRYFKSNGEMLDA